MRFGYGDLVRVDAVHQSHGEKAGSIVGITSVETDDQALPSQNLQVLLWGHVTASLTARPACPYFRICSSATFSEWCEQQSRIGRMPEKSPEELEAARFYEVEIASPGVGDVGVM